MTQKEYSTKILNLLISSHAQLLTLREFLIVFICDIKKRDQKEITKLFTKMAKQHRDKLMKSLNDDPPFDVDNLLNRIL